jgi:hypothetical protein
MSPEDTEEMMKVCETQVSEFIYVLAGKDLVRSAELLDDMGERLQGMAYQDRERARKRGARGMR